MRRAVFLDKDGTVVENVPYNADPDRVRLAPGVPAGLRAFAEDGYDLVIVTNQSGVAHGFFDESAVRGIEARIRHLLEAGGVSLAGFYWCPHHPEGTVARYAVPCDCRKPAPGLLRRAARDLGISLGSSWMAGDILDDVEAGHRAGCRTVLVDNGGETQWVLSPSRVPELVVTSLEQAAAMIRGQSPTWTR